MKQLDPKFIRLTPKNRLYQLEKPIIALTGGIATGKSTVSKILQNDGYTIIDADQLVKSIYEKEQTKKFIKENVPLSWENDKINFPKLREAFFQNKELKNKIEQFIYSNLPDAFISASKDIQNQDFYIYDVPLLYEKNLEGKVDLVILIYADRKTQLQRIITRDGSTSELANKILDQQIDIDEKKKKSDFVIENVGSMENLTHEIQKNLSQILK
jgi:dephospho-CoA kinase